MTALRPRVRRRARGAPARTASPLPRATRVRSMPPTPCRARRTGSVDGSRPKAAHGAGALPARLDAEHCRFIRLDSEHGRWPGLAPGHDGAAWRQASAPATLSNDASDGPRFALRADLRRVLPCPSASIPGSSLLVMAGGGRPSTNLTRMAVAKVLPTRLGGQDRPHLRGPWPVLNRSRLRDVASPGAQDRLARRSRAYHSAGWS